MQLENIIEYPAHVWNMEEIKALSAVIDKWITADCNELDSMDNNLFVLTSDLAGVKRRENILGISPLDSDTLEERRYKVLLKWYDTYPYTEADLNNRLTRLCTDGNYSLTIDSTAMTLEVKLGLSNKKNFTAMLELLEELVPLHIATTVSLLYNRNSTLSQFTHAQLAAYTHTQLREDVLPGNQ